MSNVPALDIFDQVFVKSIFQRMSGKYWVNDFCSFGLTDHWRRRAINSLHLPQGASVCDLMTGTGESWSFILDAIGKQGQITAVDFSEEMLEVARERVRRLNFLNVTMVRSEIFSYSFPTHSFDAITCTFGAKLVPPWKWDDFAKLIASLLKPTGRFVLLELGRPSNAFLKGPYDAYVRHAVPFLASLLAGSDEGFELLEQYTKAFEGFESMRQAFQRAGLYSEVKPFFGGCGSLLVGSRLSQKLAEGEGFEPPVRFPVHSISSRAL